MTDAEKEQIKLRAVFYNNIAVGAFVAGGLIPLLAIYSRPRNCGYFYSAFRTQMAPTGLQARDLSIRAVRGHYVHCVFCERIVPDGC